MPADTITQTPAQVAAQVLDLARQYGLTLVIGVEDGTLRVQRSFKPGDVDAYYRADSDAREVLSLVRYTRPGTVWGTDSGSIGGYDGLTKGYYRLTKSGCSKRVLREVIKQGSAA